MDNSRPTQTDFDRIRSRPRQVVRLSQEALIKTGYLDDAQGFPLVVEPYVENLNLVSWALSNREFIEAELLRNGAILFRGFDLDSLPRFEQFARAISPELLDYRERAAPRQQVGSQIYTSTEFPADQYIPLHHELAHSHNWPMKIWFFCAQPASQGGATPIAEDRKVFRLIDPEIKEEFIRRKVMYVRNYGEGVDMPWQEVFQTNERAVVEEYCRNAHIECEWKDNDHVRMRAVRQSVAVHPKTKEMVWFNHAHMFHMSNLEPEVRSSLLSMFEEDELPRNAFYGDGSPIESSVLDEIRSTYDRAAVRFPWQRGDVMMLDNFLASHGRDPFVGPRKILVAMAEPYTSEDI